MTSAVIRFNDRVQEVTHYFKLLDAMDSSVVNRRAFWRDGQKRLPKVVVDELSVKMLKATSFLLLYNLIEATVRDAVESIWAAVGASETDAMSLIPELRDTWVGSEFRSKDAFSASGKSYRDIASGILVKLANGQVPRIEFRRVMGGGTIGKEALVQMCQSHALRFDAPKNTRDGADLETVKGRRNVLAHGEQSFEEIGANYTVSDLREIKLRVVAYLRQYCRRVDEYVANVRYRVA